MSEESSQTKTKGMSISEARKKETTKNTKTEDEEELIYTDDEDEFDSDYVDEDVTNEDLVRICETYSTSENLHCMRLSAITLEYLITRDLTKAGARFDKFFEVLDRC